MTRRSLAVALVAVLLLTGCADSMTATGRWRYLPPPEVPFDRPFTPASDLCTIDDATLVKLTGVAMTPMPPITQPAGNTMCRWVAGPRAAAGAPDQYVQLDGMPGERVKDWGEGMLELVKKAPAQLFGGEARIKDIEAVITALPDQPTQWEGCEAADEISRIVGGTKDGNAFVNYPKVVGPLLNGGTMVQVSLCSNGYFSVLWAGSRTWTKANAPVETLLHEQLFIHGRLSEL